MTTHRRYSFQKRELPRGHDDVRRILETACERYWWYRDPEVEGGPFGWLVFTFTVSARDQWFAHTRAMRLATDCYYAIGLTEKDVPEPVWETLAPHMNRGRWRVPAAS